MSFLLATFEVAIGQTDGHTGYLSKLINNTKIHIINLNLKIHIGNSMQSLVRVLTSCVHPVHFG